MTSRSIRYAVIFSALALLPPQQSFGQAKAPAVQALEFSLRSLYDSASEVGKKNKWLSDEIARLSQEAIFLTEELKSLESAQVRQQVDTAVNQEGVLQEMPWEEERANMMIEDLAELNEEEKYLKDRLDGKSSDQKEIEQAVVRLQREAAELSKEQAILKEKLQQPPESKEFERLKETLARSNRNLDYAQKKYARLEKELGLPVKEFKESKVKNRSLEAKEDYLQKQLEAAHDREGQLARELDTLLKDEQIVDLDRDIDALEAQKSKLAGALQKAESKLGPDFKVPAYEPELEAVKGNIDVIKEENRELKEKLMELEKKIHTPENNAPPG